ncbi:MAG TPA: hypothetical protein VHQ90_25860 [Thermoanaerobaculia bacterium]|nr:hypothetical protein [Thermoanaerobaculia bacterium]
MTKINLGRVILGGLLAGLLVNIGEFLLHTKVIVAEETAQMAAKGGTMGDFKIWIIYSFVYGIALVWLYAAIRPRFGAGAGAAACAGATAWFFGGFLSAVAMVNLGLFPLNTTVITTIWGLVESVIAAIAGAWLYKET